MPKLENKVAIVTGAASGQGATEAKLFAQEGAKVMLTDINDAGGAALAKQIGPAARFAHHDVSNGEDWSTVVAATLQAFGKIDILINNAGIYKPKSFAETDQALLDLHYRINALSVFLGMKAVQPAMSKNGGGAIVNISSGAALRGFTGLFAYAASKWMIRGLTKCAALELAPSQIRVNTILPGVIDTPMLAENSEEALKQMKAAVPMGRLGTTDDIAQAALYLASDASSYVSGAELTVCGAIVA
jgi:3alpha(or 20beta)-hydroxysteroid dehydrogenase